MVPAWFKSYKKHQATKNHAVYLGQPICGLRPAFANLRIQYTNGPIDCQNCLKSWKKLDRVKSAKDKRDAKAQADLIAYKEMRSFLGGGR